MKKNNWKALLLPITLVLALAMTACGGSGTGTAGTENKTAEETAAEEAAESATAAEQSAEAAASEALYTGNGLTITPVELESRNGNVSLHFEITNESDAVRNVDLYPLIVNDAVVSAYGVYETIEPGQTVTVNTSLLEEGLLQFAGITSVETIDGDLEIASDNYEEILEDTRIRLYTGEGDPAQAVQTGHSEQVIYDVDGVKISYLGTYTANNDGRAVFLASNDTEDTVRVFMDETGSRIEGEGDLVFAWESASIPAGKYGLVTVCIMDENYDIAEFESADIEMEVFPLKYDLSEYYVPLHLTSNGQQIEVEAGEPYDPNAKPKTSYTTVDITSLGAGEGNIKEYIMAFTDSDGILTGIIDELVFPKSEGYDSSVYDYLDIEAIFPGITETSFTDFVKEEDEENVYYIIVFRNLKDWENLRALHDMGFLQLTNPDAGGSVLADPLIDSYVAKGGVIVDPAEIGEAHLFTELMELQ